MKKRDLVLIAILIIIPAVFIAARHSGRRGASAYVYTGSTLYGVYDLAEHQEFTIESENGIINEIAVDDDGIYMKRATCPNRLCVKCGHIRNNNESLCCAPSGVLIVIRSDKEGEYDAVTK